MDALHAGNGEPLVKHGHVATVKPKQNETAKDTNITALPDFCDDST
ncbi:MAG: hypothetical protein JJ920_04205 [Roseitalea sp.]|jgi:hypothetical protein|nr:hypothetical protein [Roseitalea sp.]MBO6721532.1 hypothetical protein [Roseitalea sp.]MBO6742089.1 hypothetical protein [Roseitalea sp.]